MSSHKRESVGIKELKDRASEIIAGVQQTGRAVSVTRNNQEVAKIIPIPTGPRERLVAAGLVRTDVPAAPLGELKLKGPAADASAAIDAILEDRDQD